MNSGCYNIVGTIRVLPKQDEKWIKYETDKMVYKEKLCPCVCHADFECFCIKQENVEDDVNNKTKRKIESNHDPKVMQLILKLERIMLIL